MTKNSIDFKKSMLFFVNFFDLQNDIILPINLKINGINGKIIIILACAIVTIEAISGRVFTNKTVSDKTTKSVLIKPSNLDNKNVQTVN